MNECKECGGLWAHNEGCPKSVANEEGSVTIALSDGTVASWFTDDDNLELIATHIESAFGIRMNLQT